MITADMLTRQIVKRSYYQFFLEFWDTVVQDPFEYNWHIEYICNELQAVGERIIAREVKEYDLVINVSPGESKSTICTILFPVWLWTRDPSLRIITGSYSGSISIKHSTSSRDCIRSEKFRRLFGEEVNVRPDIDAKTLYANDRGGERYCTSTGASVTGNHGHIVIIDDPINPAQTASEAALLTAENWITKTLPTRVVDKKIVPTILIMQRLHEKDPTTIFLKQRNIRHICLPADDSFPVIPESLRANYVNGLMNPTRTDRAVLESMIDKLGSLEYAGQFGQQPTSQASAIIRRAWWKYYTADDMPAGLVWDMWIDGAYTKSGNNDPTGIMICAFDRVQKRLFIRYAEAARMEMPELLRRVGTLCERFGLSSRSRVYIEPKASGKSLKQLLGETGDVSAVEITGTLIGEGKEARIQTAAPRVESGRVYLSGDASCELVIYQNETFPRGNADEFVDLLGYACDKYFGKPRKQSNTATF